MVYFSSDLVDSSPNVAFMVVAEKLTYGLITPYDFVPQASAPGFAAHHPPVIVEVKPYATPVHIRQRPCSREAITAIYEIIQKFLKAGILVPIQSPWNTPILPIRKPDGVSFRPVQDLRIINDVTVTIHPAVPNPYTLLSLIPPKAKWFSVIDLKDAFFTIPIHPVSQPLFAFEWENPTTGTKLQYTWTRLPQGFKNSPTLFGTALGRDLQYYVPRQKGDTVLQYVDDVLITGQTEDLCWENTKALFVLLVECGYRASRNKAQLVKQRVRYLGYDIEHGKRSLGPERKAVLAIAEPTTRRQLRGFLGLAGFCRIWIPNFALLAAPLYASTKGGNTDEFIWTEEQSRAFKEIKRELTRAPALALPNLEKPFNLYVDTKQNIALGVLTQQLGAWQRPIAYLSKQLDGVAKGWPHCLKVLAAIAELLQDCNKLTFSCPINVHTPHAVQSVLDNKGHLWISNQRLVKYQAMMIENPHVRLHVSTRLNPATLLPIETTLEHDCLHVLDNVYSTRPDLSDIPLPNAKYNWFTDGSSYMHEGKRVAGYAIVDDSRVIESGLLGSKRSAQVAELWALIRALNRAEDETLNVWTDSKYAFLTLHAHGAVYKERGFRDSAGKFIQHGHLIQYLIDAVKKPKKVSVMHCKGHQRGDDRVALGNRAADLEARAAALRDDVTPDLSILIAQDLSVIPPTIKPSYSQAECAKAVNDLKADLKDGWYTLGDGRIYVPASAAWPLVQMSHETTHMGKTALETALGRDYYIDGLAGIVARVTTQCEVCAKVNPRQGPIIPPGTIPQSYFPMDSIMIDFTDMSRCGLYKAMLVMVDMYTGWPEAFPTKSKQAREVARLLLKEVIPRFGNPSFISSDNGPEFVHHINQALAQAVGIKWRFHSAYHPQRGATVERMNRTLKEKITKICAETHLKWPDALPLALYAVRSAPRRQHKLSPFELMYGRPPVLLRRNLAGWPDLGHKGGVWTMEMVQELNKQVTKLRNYVLEQSPPRIITQCHSFQPGDRVWVKHWKKEQLEGRWKGPYVVIMSSPLAVKIAESKSWIHWTRVKKAADQQWTVQPGGHPYNLRPRPIRK
ncbi:protein NYNRIN-like [Ahaetulla prasina]|uniref:protein NYNRIN-like n=1 Tax=Ahaetulla prasina TaxID=499056 RepID=UPI002647B76B|nr:protein NYNRIN-like [Ahaetulla prasina]